MLHMRQGFLVGFLLLFAGGPLWAAPVALDRPPSVGATETPAPRGGRLPWALLALSVTVGGITIRKDVGSIAAKYATRAQAASGDYKDGVQNAGQSWEANTGAAEANWEQGTQAAMTAKRFARNVAGKAAKYQQNAVQLGSQRYGPGVANAKDAYAKGMGPVLSVLSGLSLPPKSFRGSPGNQARANAVGVALAALRASH